jgi:hypothetical protein
VIDALIITRFLTLYPYPREKYFTTHRLINIILIIHIKQYEKKYYCFPWLPLSFWRAGRKTKTKKHWKLRLKAMEGSIGIVESYPFAKYRLQRTASD